MRLRACFQNRAARPHGDKRARGGVDEGRRAGQPYVFVRPAREDADTAAISGWLSSLRGTKATKYLPDTPAERKRTGVEKPVVEATFQRGTT